jgi:hypothetical protein
MHDMPPPPPPSIFPHLSLQAIAQLPWEESVMVTSHKELNELLLQVAIYRSGPNNSRNPFQKSQLIVHG